MIDLRDRNKQTTADLSSTQQTVYHNTVFAGSTAETSNNNDSNNSCTNTSTNAPT
jgi:hypothetical protein